MKRIMAGIYGFGCPLGIFAWLVYENYIRYGVGGMLRSMVVFTMALFLFVSWVFALQYCATGKLK